MKIIVEQSERIEQFLQRNWSEDEKDELDISDRINRCMLRWNYVWKNAETAVDESFLSQWLSVVEDAFLVCM